MDEFELSNTDYGNLSAAFLFAYAFGQLFGGKLIDALGTKRALTFAVALWSIAGILHAFGQGFRSFFLFRVLLGIGEAANFPAVNKAIAEWFPATERSLAVGIVTAGPGLGSILAPPIVASLVVMLSWQWAFVITGLIGFVWLWFWHRAYYSPADHPNLPAQEAVQIIEEVDAIDQPTKSWLEFFKYRETWGLMISRFFADGAFYFLIFWLPLYLANERGMDIKAIGLFAWIPFVAADLGSLSGGWAGKKLIDNGMSLDAARKLIIWIGALLVLAIVPAANTESTATFIGLICIGLFAIQFKSSNLFTLPADMFPAKEVATIWGIFGAAGSLGGALFQSQVGVLIDTFSYQPVFLAVGSMHIVSALAVMIFIPRIARLGPAIRQRHSDNSLK
jgi:MFS transporter, ACS family, hexuronate transporter